MRHYCMHTSALSLRLSRVLWHGVCVLYIVDQCAYHVYAVYTTSNMRMDEWLASSAESYQIDYYCRVLCIDVCVCVVLFNFVVVVPLVLPLLFFIFFDDDDDGRDDDDDDDSREYSSFYIGWGSHAFHAIHAVLNEIKCQIRIKKSTTSSFHCNECATHTHTIPKPKRICNRRGGFLLLLVYMICVFIQFDREYEIESRLLSLPLLFFQRPIIVWNKLHVICM